MSGDLLLVSSIIYKNPTVLGKIHQSFIDLKGDVNENDVKSLIEEAYSYLKKESNTNILNEVFSLISACFSRFPTQFDSLFKEIFDQSRLTSENIIVTASILSSLTHINPHIDLPDYNSFVNDALNEILPQIQKRSFTKFYLNEISQISVFGKKIPNAFKYDLVIDLLLSSTLTADLLQNFLPFVCSQKIYTKNPKFTSLVHDTVKNGLTQFLPPSVLSDEDLYANLSSEELADFFPFLSDQLFIQIFPQFERTFIESPHLSSSFVTSLLERCEKSNMKLQKIERIFNFLSSSELTSHIINHLKKYDFVVPNEFVNFFNDTEKVDLCPGVCVHFDRSLKNEKEAKFNDLDFSPLESLLTEGKLVQLLDEIVFKSYPPNRENVTFLLDFLKSLNEEKSELFYSSDQNKLLLEKMLQKEGVFPPPFLLKLVDRRNVFELHQAAKNESDPHHHQITLLQCIFYFSRENEGSEKRPLESVTIFPLKNETNEALIEFIEKNDFELICKLNNEELSLVSSALLFASNGTNKVVGLTKENILSFYAIVLNNRKAEKECTFDFLFPESELKNVLKEGCKMLANSESKINLASINAILKIENENKNLLNSIFTLLIVESLADLLADSEYHSDKECLFQFIFNFSESIDVETCLNNGINIIKFMIHNMNNSMNFDNLKLNLGLFKVNEVSELFSKTLQDQESSANDVINAINLIQNLTVNVPNLKIEKTEKLLSVATEKIKEEKWDDLSLICKFFDDYHFDKEIQSLLKEKVPSEVRNKFLYLIPIEERTVDDFISLALEDPNLETNDSVLEDLFKRIMNEKQSALSYLKILIEIMTNWPKIEPSLILQYYYNEYVKYGDLFIKAIELTLLYHPNSKKFVLNPGSGSLEIVNSDFVNTLLSKLFQITSENPEKYQTFILLKSIVCTFPFFFDQNPKQIFTSVLPALDNYSLIFDEEFQKNKNNNENFNNNNDNNKKMKEDSDAKLAKIKAAFTAFSFLYSSLKSTKVLDTFCVWLFEEIQNLSNSQVYCFILIMQKLLLSDTKLPFLSIICKNINKIVDLIKRDLPESDFSTDYYNHLYELINSLFIILKDIDYKFLIMDELCSIRLPFCHYFNYKTTTLSYQCKTIISPINSETFSKFCNEIERNRSFWLIYYVTKQKQLISNEQVNKFIDHFKKLVHVYEPFQKDLELKELDYKRTEKMDRFAIRKGMWIYDYFYSYKSFPLLPEHVEILNPIITKLNSFQEEYFYSVWNLDKKKYFLFLTNNETLYKVLYDRIMKSNKTNLTKLNSIFSSGSVNETCTRGMFDYCSKFYENMSEKNENGYILLTTIDVLFSSLRNFSNSTFFNYSYSLRFIEKIVGASMRPQYRTNRNFLLKLSQLLSLYNKGDLHVSISHIIGFMLLFEDEEMIRKSILLCSKYNYNDLSHLSIVQDVYDREIQKKNISPLIITDFCNLFPCVVRARKLETLTVLESVLPKCTDPFISSKDKDTYDDLIFAMLDVLVPSRDTLNSFPMSDTLAIELKVGNRKFTFQPIPEFVRNSYPKFWSLFDENRSTISSIIDKRKDILSNYKMFNEYPELFDFKIRLTYFRERMKEKLDDCDVTYLTVKRDDILNSTLKSFEEEEEFIEYNEYDDENDKVLKKWKQYFEVTFEGEEGIDDGGLTKDWFNNVSKALFDPELGLFVEKEKTRSYQPSPLSRDLNYFKFAGRLIARAIIEGINIEFHLTQPFIKQILRRRISLNDFENVDPIKYNSFKQILKSDIDNDPSAEYYFEVTKEGSNGLETVELMKNGSQIKVTNENKIDFVNLVSNYYLRESIEDQIKAFCDGFDELISHREIRIFSAGEFDMLLCGVPFIDVKDMKRNTKFEGDYNMETPVVKLFFVAIEKWEQPNLAKLLLFFTGSPVMPVGGFKNEKITIAPGGERNYLPRAHTCCSKIDLPKYEDEDELNEKLMLAINEESFQLA